MEQQTVGNIGRAVAAVIVVSSTLSGQAVARATPSEPAQPGPRPQAHASCEVHDGTARLGQRVGSNPPRFRYAQTLAVGARFDTCLGNVRLYYGNVPPRSIFATHHNIAYGQRVGGTDPIFSHQVEVPDSERFGARYMKVFDTREVDRAPVYAFFRVQSCTKGRILGGSNCGPWSPVVTVALDGSELTAY